MTITTRFGAAPSAWGCYIAPPAPDYVDARVLGVATAEQHTLPADANWVTFTATGPFWALFGTNPTAAIPAADVTDGTSPILSPTLLYIGDLLAASPTKNKLSLISAAAQTVVMSFYK